MTSRAVGKVAGGWRSGKAAQRKSKPSVDGGLVFIQGPVVSKYLGKSFQVARRHDVIEHESAGLAPCVLPKSVRNGGLSARVAYRQAVGDAQHEQCLGGRWNISATARAEAEADAVNLCCSLLFPTVHDIPHVGRPWALPRLIANGSGFRALCGLAYRAAFNSLTSKSDGFTGDNTSKLRASAACVSMSVLDWGLNGSSNWRESEGFIADSEPAAAFDVLPPEGRDVQLCKARLLAWDKLGCGVWGGDHNSNAAEAARQRKWRAVCIILDGGSAAEACAAIGRGNGAADRLRRALTAVGFTGTLKDLFPADSLSAQGVVTSGK